MIDNQPLSMDNALSQTTPSAAASEAVRQLSPVPATQQLNLDASDPNVAVIDDTKTKSEGLNAMSVDLQLPAEGATEEGLGITTTDDGEAEEDSFVEQIKTRTPGKRISRIEDSVEALDALEEEIEKVDGLIPEPNDVQSPTKNQALTKTSVKTAETRENGSMGKKKPTTAAMREETKKLRGSARTADSRSSVQPRSAENTKPRVVVNTKAETTDKRAGAAPMTASQQSQAQPKKRVSAIHKAPFQPAKSTKPPTRSTFELPGEAIARKLKEQREERMRRGTSEESKPVVFKARPIRHSQALEVKLTAATKARLSMAKGEPVVPSVSKTETSKPRSSTRPESTGTTERNKRLSTLSVAKRNTKPPPANSSARVIRPSLSNSTATRKPSVSDGPRPAPTAEDLALQKVKGKEVFARAKVEIRDRENAKKEKEEAAKKARIEAAERGRIASRAWAEQQKLKKIEAEKAKNKPMLVEAER